MKIDQRMQPIRLILSDVDGVLTDGAIVYNNQGIESKSFHVRDGMGIKMWQKAGHKFGVLTARTSHLVKLRMSEIGVELVRQGVDDKLPAAVQIADQLGITLEETCYIGDDLPDLQLLSKVQLAVSVADAAEDIKAAAHFVTKASGGRGAMRELIEKILKSQKRWSELLSGYQ
jgi:YrbI family 3-deoxy-D-manno-octulosonate 8-phosphate phosphatase